MALLHGGQLSRVAMQYQIPETDWADLSTGIAPFSYPIPCIPTQYWQNLPTISEDLIDTAKRYYQATHCWPLAGSQQLIEKLPHYWEVEKQLMEKHVYLPRIGYKEHQRAWENTGYQLHFYQTTLPTVLPINSVVVIINPNNPLTDTFSSEQLKSLEKQCRQQQALLVIDEAFADIFEPNFSFVQHFSCENENVIVLRSFGKFFGLAGLRIGFVCSSKKWCDRIKEDIGPWSINGPALYIAECALKDRKWQQAQRQRLKMQSQKLESVLLRYLPSTRIESNALFITVFSDNAPAIYNQLCQQAVYVRLTDENNALRFGIPTEAQLVMLQEAFFRIKNRLL